MAICLTAVTFVGDFLAALVAYSVDYRIVATVVGDFSATVVAKVVVIVAVYMTERVNLVCNKAIVTFRAGVSGISRVSASGRGYNSYVVVI